MSDPTRRPRITLVVFAYNQSAMIDAAIDSALAQVGEPIEILLSDDASPDDTFARMQAKAAAYRGPHQVRVRRNPTNLGINGHFNAVVEAAQGGRLGRAGRGRGLWVEPAQQLSRSVVAAVIQVGRAGDATRPARQQRHGVAGPTLTGAMDLAGRHPDVGIELLQAVDDVRIDHGVGVARIQPDTVATQGRRRIDVSGVAGEGASGPL